MSYSIDVLQKEHDILLKCLTEWESLEYEEARKERERRLKDLSNSISILKQQPTQK